jgi:hypothetical protein
MEIEFVVSLVAAAMALVGGLIRTGQQVRATQARIDRLINARLMQVHRLRKGGRQSLNMARDLRLGTRRRSALEDEVFELAQRLEKAKAVDHRVFVLDDRRTKNDLSWVVTISNPTFATSVNAQAPADTLQSWQEGRRFVVWALDANKAREKAAGRYPERSGFRVVSVVEWNDQT